MAIDIFSSDNITRQFSDEFMRSIAVGRQVEVIDANVIIRQARRRSDPNILIPAYSWEISRWLDRDNLVYITAANEYEVVSLPIYREIAGKNWLFYFPPNNRARLVGVVVDEETTGHFEAKGKELLNLLSSLKKVVAIKQVATGEVGNLKRDAIFTEDNTQIAVATLIKP